MSTIHGLIRAHAASRGATHACLPTLEETYVPTDLSVVGRMLCAAPVESPLVQVRACFLLRRHSHLPLDGDLTYEYR